MIEKMIFNILAFSLFILVFLNLIRKNDTNYTYLLTMQALGIFINFLELMFEIKLNIPIKIFIYILSVIAPIFILLLELKMNITITEVINIVKAKIYIKANKYQAAEKSLLNTIKKYPKSQITHRLLGDTYLLQNKEEEAIREYEISMDEKYDEKQYEKIGTLYEKIGKYEQAKTIFEEIIRQNPENYEVGMKLADALFTMNELKYAVQVYQSLLRYYPTDYDIYYSLGMTYTMLNDFQKAKENYQKAAEINSISYRAKYSLGQLSLLYEDLEEATQYFEECLNEDIINAKTYYYLARISIIKGEQEKAISYLNMAVELEPELYRKIQKDTIFITIRDKIHSSNKLDKKENKMESKKEILVEEHLEKMAKIVGKFKNDDIQMIENVMKIRRDGKEEKNTEIESKEKESN